jgi:hypothetical protein
MNDPGRTCRTHKGAGGLRFNHWLARPPRLGLTAQIVLAGSIDLRIAIVAVQIREDPAFSPFQVHFYILGNPAKLTPSPLFCRPGLVFFDPGIEVKMWVSVHGFRVLPN